MKYRIFFTVFFSIGSYTPSLNATCNTGTLTAVTGSPFATVGASPIFLSYSPIIQGNVFAAVGNSGSNNVSVFSVNTSTGVLTAVSGSPFLAGSGAISATFSPVVYGNLFAAVGNSGTNTVSVYQVNPVTGVFTQVAGSPFTAGSGARYVAFSPLINGNLFAAVTNFTAGTVSVYSVNTSTGVFTLLSTVTITGVTPNPDIIAFSPIVNGNLFAAIANFGTGTVSIYSVNTSTGAFTQVTGSPFSTGAGTNGVAFSLTTSGTLFASVCAQTAGTLATYTVNSSTGALTSASSVSVSGPNGNAFSSTVSGNLFTTVSSGTNLLTYTVNTSTGALTLASTTSAGGAALGVTFSPQLSGGLFVATAESSNVAVFKVATIIPTITTLSQFILSGATVSITGSINGGTQPYAITWQDGTVQSSISTTTFSRGVSPTTPTIYDVATISDTNACTAGPSNSITIGVRTCP